MDKNFGNRKIEVEKILKPEKSSKPKYRSPEIITYSGDDILKELGTAKACSPFPP